MKTKLLVLLALGLFIGCSKDDSVLPVMDEEDDEVIASAVSNITLDDVTNNGDASDIEVTFNKVSDESLIKEYRVFVAKSGTSFDLAAAEAASSDLYVVFAADGSNKQQTLDASVTDIEGNAISEGSTYVVYVLSVADGVNATISSLSPVSTSVKLAQTTIKITYIGNDGVYISDGEKAVIVDALPGSLSGWNPIANGIQSRLESGIAPYGNVVAAMITHAHGDHLSSTSTNIFLQSNPSATLLAPPQVINVGINSGSQVMNLALDLGETEDVTLEGVPIKVIRITHFNPNDGTDFASTTESFAFLIELGGKKILHIGDGDLSSSNFSSLGLKAENIDVILIPTFNFSGQLNTTSSGVVSDFIGPKNIIGLHLATATPVSAVTAIYPNATVFNESLQFVRY